jgi:hypothetical protein
MNAKGTLCCRSQFVKLAPKEKTTGPAVKRRKPRKLGSRKPRAASRSERWRVLIPSPREGRGLG